MKLLTPPKKRSNEKRRKAKDRFTFITSDRNKLVIPIGPHFQVDVPSWTPVTSNSRLAIGDTMSDNAKWLGTPTWTMKERTQDTNNYTIGTGRPQTCVCALPGSVNCVRCHIFENKIQLKMELGYAFQKWRFDDMGESVTKLWNEEERKKLDYILKKNLTSKGINFIKFASQVFPFHSNRSIVSYYFNVHIPRRMSVQTRSRCIAIDTDDEDDVDDDMDDDFGVSGGCSMEILCPINGSSKKGSPTKRARKRLYVGSVDGGGGGGGSGREILRPINGSPTKASPVEGARKRLHADITCSRKYVKAAFITSCR